MKRELCSGLFAVQLMFYTLPISSAAFPLDFLKRLDLPAYLSEEPDWDNLPAGQVPDKCVWDYETLQACFKKDDSYLMQGGVIEIADNIVLEQPLVIPKDRRAILNLYGYTLSSQTDAPVLIVEGDLTICNFLTYEELEATTGGICAENTAIVVNGGNLTIDNGMILSEDMPAVHVNDSGNLTVNYGVIKSDNTAVYWQSSGTFTMNDGLLSGGTGLEAGGGTVKLCGGYICGTGANNSPAPSSPNIPWVEGSALLCRAQTSQVQPENALKIQIKNGHLISLSNYALHIYNMGTHELPSVTASIEIDYCVPMKSAPTQPLIIMERQSVDAINQTAITFSRLLENHTMVGTLTVDGKLTYQLQPIGAGAVQCDGMQYNNLAAAIYAVPNHGIIHLLKDIQESATIETGQNLTIDLNGHTISSTGNAFINHGTLQICDTSVGKTGMIKQDNSISDTAYAIENYGELTIKDISFCGVDDNSNKAKLIHNAIENAVLAISSGYYNGGFDIAAGKAAITGGSFSQNIHTQIAEGFALVYKNGKFIIDALVNLNKQDKYRFDAETGVYHEYAGTESQDKPDKPTDPEHPEQPDKPDKPTDPENPEQPDKPNKPTDPENPEQPDKPNKPTDPENPEQPDKPNKPTDPENPENPNKPNKPTDSKNPEQPNEPIKPDIPVSPSYSGGGSGGGGGASASGSASPDDMGTNLPILKPLPGQDDTQTIPETVIPASPNPDTLPQNADILKNGNSETLPFEDISPDDWYFTAVQYVYHHGQMCGTAENSFSPDADVTRAMFVTTLYRMEQQPSVSICTFPDVPSGQWYTDAVCWAAANQIVSGYEDGRFAPDDLLTREQLAAILMRYAAYKHYDISKSAPLSDYTDAAQISTYAVPAMQWAVAEGLISGTDMNALLPLGNASRAQMAVILMNFCEQIAK